MVNLRLTPKQIGARIIVVIVGLAIGAYGVALFYKPLQSSIDLTVASVELQLIKWQSKVFKTNWIYARLSSFVTTNRSTMNEFEKHSVNKNKNGSQTANKISGYRDESPSDSLFKRVFKFYKRHDAVPDFSKVIDMRCSSPIQGIVCSKFNPLIKPSDIILKKLGLRPLSQWTVTTVTHRPGMIMLNDIFEPESHLEWIKRSLYVYAESPGFTNVGLHIPDVQNVFREHAKQLRWTTLGLHYDWTSKTYPFKGQPLPEELVSLAEVISQTLGLGPMSADAAIINFYARKSTLAPHVDSFGQTAIYLAGGTDLDDPVDAFYIRSGDVLVIYGPQRLIYHGVPRIFQDCKFDKQEQPEEIIEYANGHRVNITIRQVDRHD